MTREIPIPATVPLRNGIIVSLSQSGRGWVLHITPLGANAGEKLKPRWTARYVVTPKTMPKEPTVRDGALVLAEELCLALDGWLELAMVEAPY
jgi:hypothetical protein